MAQNDKGGGSDLDVFDGLGKRDATAGSSAVPAPPAQRAAGTLDPKRTLVGVTIPNAVAPLAGGLPVPPARTPPPPPGRGSLPPVVSPRGAPIPRAAPSDKASAAVDMNWDEDDEATQIFDEREDPPKSPAPSGHVPLKATLLGLPVPNALAIPAPPALAGGGYPAPPSSPAVFGRAPGFPASPGGPTLSHTQGGLMPPPAPTQPGLGMGFPAARSSMPPPMPSAPPPAASSTPFPRPSSEFLVTGTHGMEQTALVRPPPNRTALWVGVGLAAAAAVFVAFVFFGAPQTGRIVIGVTDSKGADVNRVEIFVDGRKQCDTAPCVVDPVAVGAHEVKILADDMDTPSVQTVTVESHKDTPATFTLGSLKGGTGIKVSGTQPGVKLYVDDKEVGPLPQELRDLSPGDHALKVSGSERYQALEKHVSVAKDQMVDLGSMTLKVLKGKATISSTTPGARVYLISGADRRELPTLPISVDIDTTKTLSLEASKLGFEDFKQPISFDDGQAEKAYTVNLEPRAAAAPAFASPAAPAAPPAVAPSPAPAPAPAPAPVAQAAQAAPASESGEAFLNINSIPPSTCFLDGRSLGSTPRVHVSVKPGAHTVKFVNADEGLSKTLSVSVGPGETKPAVAKLN